MSEEHYKIALTLFVAFYINQTLNLFPYTMFSWFLTSVSAFLQDLSKCLTTFLQSCLFLIWYFFSWLCLSLLNGALLFFFLYFFKFSLSGSFLCLNSYMLIFRPRNCPPGVSLVDLCFISYQSNEAGLEEHGTDFPHTARFTDLLIALSDWWNSLNSKGETRH